MDLNLNHYHHLLNHQTQPLNHHHFLHHLHLHHLAGLGVLHRHGLGGGLLHRHARDVRPRQHGQHLAGLGLEAERVVAAGRVAQGERDCGAAILGGGAQVLGHWRHHIGGAARCGCGGRGGRRVARGDAAHARAVLIAEPHEPAGPRRDD